MVIALGAHPWRNQLNHLNIPEGDLWNLKYNWMPAPYLAYFWWETVTNNADWVPDNWRVLASMGWYECFARLWFPGTSNSPTILPEVGNGVGDNAVEGLVQSINDALMNKIWIYCAQIDNEGNLEHRVMTPLEYAKRIAQIADAFRYKYPQIPIGIGALAQWEPGDPANFDAYYNELKYVIRDYADYQVGHYYFGKYDGDKQPGYKGSPEWLRAQIPSLPVIISETGNAAVQHELDLLDEWSKISWLRSYHVYILSHPEPDQQKWVYTEATGNSIRDRIKGWREMRVYPIGFPISTDPIPTVDLHKLKEHMSAQYALAEADTKELDKAIAECLIILERLRKARGWSSEMLDRVQGVWDDYGLGAI